MGVPDIAVRIVGTGDNHIISIDWLVFCMVQGCGLFHFLSLQEAVALMGVGVTAMLQALPFLLATLVTVLEVISGVLGISGDGLLSTSTSVDRVNSIRTSDMEVI